MVLKEKFDKPHIVFVQSLGPNFYSRGIYKWLLGEMHSGKIPIPSDCYCPAGKTYFAVSNNDLYPCPNTCGTSEFKIGEWSSDKD